MRRPSRPPASLEGSPLPAGEGQGEGFRRRTRPRGPKRNRMGPRLRGDDSVGRRRPTVKPSPCQRGGGAPRGAVRDLDAVAGLEAGPLASQADRGAGRRGPLSGSLRETSGRRRRPRGRPRSRGADPVGRRATSRTASEKRAAGRTLLGIGYLRPSPDKRRAPPRPRLRPRPRRLRRGDAGPRALGGGRARGGAPHRHNRGAGHRDHLRARPRRPRRRDGPLEPVAGLDPGQAPAGLLPADVGRGRALARPDAGRRRRGDRPGRRPGPDPRGRRGRRGRPGGHRPRGRRGPGPPDRGDLQPSGTRPSP